MPILFGGKIIAELRPPKYQFHVELTIDAEIFNTIITAKEQKAS